MAAIPVEPEVRSRGGASSAARSRFAADSLLEGVGFEPSVPGESRGSRQVNILQILAGRLSGYPTVGRCGDVRFRALVKGSTAWLLCLPVGQASSLASSCCSTLFLLTRPKTGLSARDQRFESGSLQRRVCELSVPLLSRPEGDVRHRLPDCPYLHRHRQLRSAWSDARSDDLWRCRAIVRRCRRN
jgi:hypothetical protein